MATNNHYTIPCTIIRAARGGYLVEIQFQGQAVVERRRVVRTAEGWGIIQETAKKAGMGAILKKS